VHTQWSHDTGPQASMTAACTRAVELGLPAVAFTEHLDFTAAGRETRSGPPEPSRMSPPGSARSM